MSELDCNKNGVIKIDGFDISLEELFGRRKFYTEIDESELHGFERKYLSSGLCSSMLPMSFLRVKDRERIYYDYTGMMTLNDYIEKMKREKQERLPSGERMLEALTLYARILRAIREGEDSMLFIERYHLSGENIFVGFYTGIAKIAYLPERQESATVRTKLAACLEAIQGGFRSREVTDMLEKLAERIIAGNLGIEGIIHAAEKMQRELRITCGICE